MQKFSCFKWKIRKIENYFPNVLKFCFGAVLAFLDTKFTLIIEYGITLRVIIGTQ